MERMDIGMTPIVTAWRKGAEAAKKGSLHSHIFSLVPPPQANRLTAREQKPRKSLRGSMKRIAGTGEFSLYNRRSATLRADYSGVWSELELGNG
jgi:hypothetical protein